MGVKISDLSAKGSNLSATDLFEVSIVSGGGYVSRSITGQQISTLTVNSTPIDSGTAGRVFFQNASNQLSQSSNLFWNNSNNRLGINTATPTVALDIVGSVKIDNTAFTGAGLSIVKDANSTNKIIGGPSAEYIQFGPSNRISIEATDTEVNQLVCRAGIGSNITGTTGLLINNIALIQANATRTGITLQTKTWRNDGAGGTSTMNAVKISPTANMTVGTTTGNVLLIDPEISTTGGTHTIRGLYYNPTLTSTTGVTHRAIETNTGSVIFNSTSGNVAIGGTSFGTSSDKVLAQYTGTAPGSSPADAYQQYSADITAGNAAPHFRTENGNIIKLYQQSSAGITTVSDLVTILQNLGLLS
jgi:hypothetical protein